MATSPSETHLDQRFSSENATGTPWEDARQQLEAAGVNWLTTVRPDGRPHVTPLLAVWHDGALHFCTGEDERKRRNLGGTPTTRSLPAATRRRAGSTSLTRARPRA